MSKKYLLTLGLSTAFILSTGLVMADVQSPIYTDEIGRSHFLGRGGYSSVRHIDMGGAQADAVNDAVNAMSQKTENVEEKTVETTERKITDVIKEKENVPVSSRSKASFTSEQRKMDATAPYGYGGTNIPAGVNESKTIYTDELGRLHFFGRANQIKE